ncbi:hypothetical protein KP79_PYT10293 [Mizuhopecten yessoensis]|uniref:Methyltransferase FkbM domain-containing protein n=1 Tax=Mizuhopecten yessoensis TaxID=6573 RepID=A0A210QBP1_MIZYE|nr:hypothetical protein KP79_PYT10293 [Mizuhopecten yessoensis]
MRFPRFYTLLSMLAITLVCVFEMRRFWYDFPSGNNTNILVYHRAMTHYNVSRGPVTSNASRATSIVPRGHVTGVTSCATSVASRLASVASRGSDASRKNVAGKDSAQNPGLIGTGGIITWSPGSVGWAKLASKCDVGTDFALGHLRRPIDTPIYVYKEEIDEVVSGSILKNGMWEDDLVEGLRGYLSGDPDLVLLDIGANVGVFSLMAAKLGRTVFSIDCLTKNVHRLCASVSAGNLLKHVTIILNAMSNTRENVSFGGYRL